MRSSLFTSVACSRLAEWRLLLCGTSRPLIYASGCAESSLSRNTSSTPPPPPPPHPFFFLSLSLSFFLSLFLSSLETTSPNDLYICVCVDDLFLAKTVLFDSVCCSLLFCFAIACLFERARSLEKEDSTERMRHPALGEEKGGGGGGQCSAGSVPYSFHSLQYKAGIFFVFVYTYCNTG